MDCRSSKKACDVDNVLRSLRKGNTHEEIHSGGFLSRRELTSFILVLPKKEIESFPWTKLGN